MSEIESLQEEFKKDPSFERMMQIVHAYNESNLTERGIGFAEAILLQMEDKERYLQMSMILESVGNSSEALICIDKLLSKLPDDKEALHTKAMMLISNDDIASASRIYIKLKNDDEEDLQAIAGLMICLFKQEQAKEAFDLYHKSSGKLPTEMQQWYPKGMIDGIVSAYLEASTLDANESEKIKNNFKYIEQIIENFGSDAKMFYVMGETSGKKMMEK